VDKITFHRKTLDSLPLPAPGQRAEYQDAAAPELVLRVAASGHKTFTTRRKINGKAVRVTLGTYQRPDGAHDMTVEQARKAATRAKAAAVEGVNPNEAKRARRVEGMTLREMLAAYVEDNKQLKAGTGAGYTAALQAVMPELLDKPLRDLTAERVQAIHKRHGAKAPAAANLAMRVLRLVWNYATSHNPKNAPAVYGENPVAVLSDRKQWFKVARRKTMIRAHALPTWWAGVEAMRESPLLAERDAADLFELLLFTGLRASEGRELQWQHLDLRAPTLTIPAPKNGDPHTLPIPSQLLPMLQRRSAGALSPYVFPARDLGQPFPKQTLQKYAHALRDETGVEWIPHDLRRGFATTAETLVSMLTVKRLLNHRTVEADVTAGYVVQDEQAMADAMQRIADKIDEARSAKGEEA
jgi:integrase